MRLGAFIESNLEPILSEWETFARSIAAASGMDSPALRDHARGILRGTVRDMRSPQSALQQSEKSKGLGPEGGEAVELNDASESHAAGRLASGFDLLELVSEYRALRASVLRLWAESGRSVADFDNDDVTRFNESLDQSLTRAVRSYAESVDEARDMFLAILGHDLRNPLQAIAVSAQVLSRVTLDPDRMQAYSKHITTSVGVMGRMIGELLEYTRSRLGSGMPVVPAPVDLEPLAREVYDESRVAHPERNVRFHVDGDLHGRWDADRLRQALSNLMGNAIQHGDEHVPVTFSLAAEADGVVVRVHNGGPPIPAGELATIFDPLIRGVPAAQPKPNRPGSLGLGLYIAREVARSHGGHLDVTSTADDGTTFTLRLPRQTPATAAT